MHRFRIFPQGPFDLAHQRGYFGEFPTLANDPSAVVLTFPVERSDASTAVVLRQSAPDGEISGEIYGCDDAPASVIARAQTQALATLSIDVDGAGWAKVGARDPIIGALQKKYLFIRPTLFFSPYDAATHFIVGHRINMKQSRAIRARMAHELGAAIAIGDETFFAFPSPRVLAGMKNFPSLPELKIQRLHAAAHAALDGLLDRAHLRSLAPAVAREQLEELPGVGPFFSQGILNRGAGLTDEITDDDLTKYAVKMAYGLEKIPSPQEILTRAEAWRPYRMWAVVLLHIWLRREVGLPKRRFA